MSSELAARARRMIEQLARGEDLRSTDLEAVFEGLVDGALDPALLSGLLVGLKCKGETPEEISAAARALVRNAQPFPRPEGVFVDSCGTGGDGASTINVSTGVAFVLAAAGIKVAKHGNRSVSSKCGSSDVLESFGINLELSPARSRALLDEVGVCFLFAPQYHPGLRHAMPVRRSLGVRTIMNVLGPLVNPARPPVQMVGVYGPELVEPMARTLGLLGTDTALVVHGSGLDEIATHGPTVAAHLDRGRIEVLELDPGELGVSTHTLEELRGGGPDENAAALRRVLGGQGEPAHEAIISLNAGALIWLAGQAPDLNAGVRRGREVIGSGAPLDVLERYAQESQRGE